MENPNTSSTTGDETPKKSPNLLARLKISPKIIELGLTILAILAISIGAYYWYTIGLRVYSDKAEIFAPLIILSPSQPSVLQEMMTKEGDQVSADQAVAKLDNNQFVRAKTEGIVVGINNQVGKLFTPGMPVVTMINPSDLRLIVHVEENKGLSSIQLGQKVIFTVDAFGSKQFFGTLEQISQTSDQSSVVFSISDKRDEKYFSIKVKYEDHPELLNGMSAKAWIYK